MVGEVRAELDRVRARRNGGQEAPRVVEVRGRNRRDSRGPGKNSFGQIKNPRADAAGGFV